MNYISKSLFSTLFACCAGITLAQAPAGYYSACEGKSGKALLEALHSAVASHTTISYDGLYEVYNTSDVRANGTVWDMYSTKEWTPGKNKCGSYKAVGDCYNREHSFPKSWFDDKSPMVSDAFHVYPTDGKVNGQRSNHPYGECANGTRLPSHNGVTALGRLGTSTFSGYSGTVFEPDDQYKGDFARSYFYMAACYNNRIASWNSAMLAGNSYPVFTPWAVNLLMKWHRQDPVSQKEIDRNNAVYAHQKNRNPFIDHPELAEFIWGDKQGAAWSPATGGEANPVINRPINGSTIDMGITSLGHPIKYVLNVKSTGLTDNIRFTLSSTDFTIDTPTMSAEDVNTDNGDYVTITFSPKVVGNASCKLSITRIATGKELCAATLTATAIDGLPAIAATDVTPESFIARWKNIGDATADGCYRLSVYESASNSLLAGYPKSVIASDEHYEVDGLDPETTYYYQLASKSMTSDKVFVTTTALQPDIEILFDGDLSFSAVPGEPSEVAELLLDVDNIPGNIYISVKEPFEVSTDRSNWSTRITLLPDEDRFYMRVNSPSAGVFTTSIVAEADGYYNDEATVEAIVAEHFSFFEDFEAAITTSGYDGGAWTGTATTWNLFNAGIYKGDGVDKSQGCRFGKQANSSITMTSDKTFGIGTVELEACRWTEADGNAEIELLYSTDHGLTWQTAGTAAVEDDDFRPCTFTVNQIGNVRIMIRQTKGKRMIIDNIKAADFSTSGIGDPVTNYHSWDAYCLDGQLVITAAASCPAAIYGIDGITYFTGTIDAGTTTFPLPAGLYIITIGSHPRHTLIK